MEMQSDGVHPRTDELIQLRLQARNLELKPLQAAKSVLAGNHHSNFRGRGMDYLESRGYQPGDDVRSMDWRVTARTGKAHVKVYQEERERSIVVMADFSPGMFFATEGAFKSIIAVRAAALFAWATIQSGDRIGALLYNSRHHELRPAGGQRGALRLIRELVKAAQPSNHTDNTESNAYSINDALSRLRRVVRPGSLVYLLSDFYHFDDVSKRHLQLLRQHNDVIACQILDRLELRAPEPARYAVTFGDQQGVLDTRSHAQRVAWTQHFAERRQRASNMMQQCAIPLIRLTTADDVGVELRSQLTFPSPLKHQEAA